MCVCVLLFCEWIVAPKQLPLIFETEKYFQRSKKYDTKNTKNKRLKRRMSRETTTTTATDYKSDNRRSIKKEA